MHIALEGLYSVFRANSRRIRTRDKEPGRKMLPDLVAKRDQIRNFEKLFAMLPVSVITSRALTDGDCRTYSAIAYYSFRSHDGICRASVADLTELTGRARSSVLRSVASLVESGHIYRTGKERGQSEITPLSPVFSRGKVLLRDSTAPAREIPDNHRGIQRKANCPRCGILNSIIPSSGVCAECMDHLRHKLSA